MHESYVLPLISIDSLCSIFTGSLRVFRRHEGYLTHTLELFVKCSVFGACPKTKDRRSFPLPLIFSSNAVYVAEHDTPLRHGMSCMIVDDAERVSVHISRHMIK